MLISQYFSVKRQYSLGVGWVERWRNPTLSTVRWVSPPLNPTYHSHLRSIGSSVRSHPHMEIWGNWVDEATYNPGCDRHPTIRTLQTATNTRR
ncbi:MAG: hypothetical protein V7K92_02265 [Nostoc sp.]